MNRCCWLPKRGQSLVEFALVAPLLFALMFILVELGIVFSIKIGLANSAREAARSGSVYQYPTGTSTPATSDVDAGRSAAMDQAVMDSLNPIIRATSISQVTPSSGVRYTYNPATPTLNNYRYGDNVVVTLSYSHPLFFNLLGPLSVTIQSQSEMRLEPGGM